MSNAKARAPLRVLHVDSGRGWGGGQNQVRLLMRALASETVAQCCICPAGSPLHARLRATGLPVRGVPWRRGTDPRAALALARHAGGWDVIHAHDGHALNLVLAPALLRRTPVVASRRVAFPTHPWKWNRTARVVAISEAVRTRLLASGVRPERIALIPSGIDVAEVAALAPLEPPLRARLDIPRDQFLVGTVGSLFEYKRQALLVEAAAALPDVHVAIIGEGPERVHLQDAIARHGIAPRVHLAGALPDARGALRELDVFVFPSEAEGLGTSVLDAMACDVPVLAADASGPGELLGPVHAQTGASLFPVGDAAALAARIANVRSDAQLRERMIAAQRRRLEDYRMETTAVATLALYRELAQ